MYMYYYRDLRIQCTLFSELLWSIKDYELLVHTCTCIYTRISHYIPLLHFCSTFALSVVIYDLFSSSSSSSWSSSSLLLFLDLTLLFLLYCQRTEFQLYSQYIRNRPNSEALLCESPECQSFFKVWTFT